MTDAGVTPPGYAGAPGPPAPGYGPPPGPPGGGGGTGQSGLVVTLSLVLVGALLVAGAVVWSIREGADSGSAGGDTGGELFLEAASSIGASPFTEPVDPTPPSTTTASSKPPATKAGSASTTVAPATQPTSGIAPAPGSPPYGGSGDDRVCDRDKLIQFLTSNPDRAAAWAGVLGIAVSTIPTYVRALTPTTLLYDTRVTNHGYQNGKATTLQSILQAGTAVLVDSKGNPVVRCRCGNPLTPPARISKPVVRGDPWPGYQPGVAVAVNNGVTVTVVINVQGGPQPTPTPTPSSPGLPSSTTTSGSGGSTSSTRSGSPIPDFDKIEGLLAVLAECTNDVQVLDVQKESDLANTYSVRAKVDGVEMVFTFNVSNGDVGEGDKASAELIARCGIVNSGGG